MADASHKTSARSTTSVEGDLTGDFGLGNNEITATSDSDLSSNQPLAGTRSSKKMLQMLRATGFRAIADPPSFNGDFVSGDSSGDTSGDMRPIEGPRYRIGKEIGNGGMGIVYEGWDVQLQRRIAIKIIRDKELAKPNGMLRFFREARLAARLQHPSILSIHEFDIDSDGQAFIVMGLLEGKTLRTVLAEDSLADGQNRNIELPELLGYFLKVCQAIAYAHSRGIIHRDLKPINIMVGRYGVVTVLDWGLAKVISGSDTLTDMFETDATPIFSNEDGLSNEDGFLDEAIHGEYLTDTRSGEMLGTPGYVSPEQARGEIDRIDRRSDIFSLGAIFCEILTGHPPYVADSADALYNKAYKASLGNAFSRLDRCGAPPILVDLVKRCLSPDPNNRPRDAAELVTTINGYLQSGQLRAEQELVRFFDLSMDLFGIASTSGYFYRVNENFERTLGYTAVELTSCPFLDFVHSEDQAKTLVEIEKLASGEPAIQFINRYRHKDGHYIWLEWMARSVPEEASVYAVARDVTDRIARSEALKKIEAEHHLLGKLVDSTEDAIICKDPNGFICSWNAMAEAVFGYSAIEIIGRHISVLLKPEQLSKELAIIDEVRYYGSVEQFQTVRIGKDGNAIRVTVSMSLLADANGSVISVSKIVPNE